MSKKPQSQGQRDLDLKDYCESFENLHTNRTEEHGNAPHKPLLLLSIIDLIEQGVITENKIFVSDELINTFNKYWNSLYSIQGTLTKYKRALYYPFFHLKSEGFWHLELKPEFESKNLKIKTTKKLRETVEYASLDERLFELIQDHDCRQELIDTLISVWFSSSTDNSIEDITDINNSFQKGIGLSKQKKVEKLPSFYTRTSPVRSAWFRQTLVRVYDYKCALCGLKVTKLGKKNQNIVEGAHIIPFSVSYNNSINNGISLCRNHHWAFDNGLFCIDREYKIVVNNNVFKEESHNNEQLIQSFNGGELLLPNSNSDEVLPSREALQWHLNRWMNQSDRKIN